MRATAAIVGVVLGVALTTLVVSINEAVSDASRSTRASDLVRADIAVQARSASGMSRQLARRIRGAAKGAPATAVLQVNSRLIEGGRGGTSYLSVLGVDTQAERFVPPGVSVHISGQRRRFDAPPLVVGEGWLHAQGLRVGDRIRLQTARGTSPWTITGSVKGDLPNQAAIAVARLEDVGYAFDRPDSVDSIYLRTPPSMNRDALVARLRKVAGPAALVGSPDVVGEADARSLLVVQAMLAVSGLVGLLSAAVVVFVCWRLLLEDERASVARFRLTGATPLQLASGAGIVLLGATLACCAAGLPLGVLAAELLHRLTGRLIGFTGLAAVFDSSGGTTPKLAGLCAGLAIAGIAWASTIRSFVAISPLEAVRPPDPPPATQGIRWWALAAGLLAALLSAAVILFLPLSWGALAVVLALVGAPLVAFGLVVPLGRALASGHGFVPLAAGRQVAADSKRTLMITLMVGLGVTAWLTLGGVATSYQQAIERSVRSWTHADLFVRMGKPGQTLRDSRFPPRVQRRLAGLKGVKEAGAFTYVVMNYQGRNAMFQAYDTEHVEGVANLIVYDGPRGAALWQALAEGKIAISQSMARLDSLNVGDSVLLPGQRGARRLQIAAVVDDYVSEGGTIVGSLQTLRTLTGERRIDDIPLVLEKGASPSVVAARVRTALPAYQSLTILDRSQFRSSITEFISSVVTLFQALAVVAFLIVLSAATLTLAASLSVRRRSLALTRIVGSTPKQIRWQLCLETSAMAATAWLVATMASCLLIPAVLHASAAKTGLLPAVAFPVSGLVIALPVGLVAALAAAALVGRMISRENLVEILHFE